MMTFYAAAGSYQIRSEDGKNMPYIMRLGKLQPVSIPEFSLWSMLLWDVLTYEELHKKFYDKMEETEIEPSSFDKSLEMLVKRMHSRIIELSKDPILKHERMCESSVPDWFYHSIADYTDADTDRDHDIKWFLDAVARVVDVAEDGKSFTFKPKAKQKYFERQYHAFLDKACELTGISLDAFVGEAKYDIGMAMYKLNEHYQDKFSLYVYFNDELKSLDEWIRETDLSGSFYFGGTLDYHY